MKPSSLLLLTFIAILVGGCTTTNIDSRKKERYGAYSQLAPDQRELVDNGKIKVGMPEEAVYIAWGEPHEILTRETEAGITVTWLYHGTYLEQHRYWRHHTYKRGHRTHHQPYLAHDYRPHSYVNAQVRFREGKVTNWQTMPRPHY